MSIYKSYSIKIIPLFSEKEFYNAKHSDKLPIKCYQCNNTFYRTKNYINFQIKSKRLNIKFCSKKCNNIAQITKQLVKCKQCNKKFEKVLSQIKKSKNHFCSHSCAATYNNSHKKHGTIRSKLEKWLENKLIEIYPKLNFHFNCKDTINSELDIYIPSLNLAFELNGIFHYEPIFGQNKLDKIQNNDKRKFQACLENNIELCIIDSSHLKHFKEQNCQKYFDIICNIINNKLL